jgi:mannose-6-phosphate isomerase-like protein (cupin superfamily)
LTSSKININRIVSSADNTGSRLIAEDRGKLAILHPRGPVYNPCYFDIQPGKARFRGGHYHKTKTEVFYVISGSCLIRYYDQETGEHGSFGVQQGDMVTILPMCAHRMEAEEFCQVMEFSLEDVDYETDTFVYHFE